MQRKHVEPIVVHRVSSSLVYQPDSKYMSHRSPDCRDVYIAYTRRDCHWTDTSCISAR